MLTTRNGEQGRMATGNFGKVRRWVRQFEGCRAVVFIRVRKSNGYSPLRMQGVYVCIRGMCYRHTLAIYKDHVEYINQYGQRDVADISMFDGQYQIGNTEMWI